MNIRERALLQAVGPSETNPTISSIDLRMQNLRDLYDNARLEFIRERLTSKCGIAFYGSARSMPYEEDYKFTAEISRRLVLTRGNIDIVTGGGPGIMEAASWEPSKQ